MVCTAASVGTTNKTQGIQSKKQYVTWNIR